MKRSSLAAALPVLVLAGLLLSGCGIFRSEKAWQTAKQQTPLEIPPTMDTPNASAALVIPPVGANRPTADGATARVGDLPGTITDGFIVVDNVDNTYRRVGEVLSNGEIGTLQSHDDAAHSYNVRVLSASQPEQTPGFFGRLFGHGASHSNGKKAATPREVVVTVNGSGQDSSEIRAQGEAAAVVKVVDSLKSRLGGKG